MDERQTALYHAAISSNPPLVTDDRLVNHEVDCMMTGERTDYNDEERRSEIRAWQISNGWILSLNPGA